ncbi:MAG: peroxiredoxin-like family protein [Candidatus Melainabacteria bacterium]|nr:peroxiredoxin-like family protein [Candidatus Melainabacteria bacterium]
MKILLTAAMVAAIFSFELASPACHASDANEQSNTPQPVLEKEMSLKQQLEALAAQSKSKKTDESKAVMQNALDALEKSGIVEQVLKDGARTPDFALPNAVGKTITLKQLLSKGPVVVTFYRGGWCPYCNLALRALEKSLPAITAQNASLVAISPQQPDATLSTVEKDKLSFEVLSDSGNTVARQFGLVYQLPPDLIKIYKGFGIDLERVNGNKSDELPLSATFIIDSDGTIAYVYVDTDYKKRMEPSDIVAELKRIKSK